MHGMQCTVMKNAMSQSINSAPESVGTQDVHLEFSNPKIIAQPQCRVAITVQYIYDFSL